MYMQEIYWIVTRIRNKRRNCTSVLELQILEEKK